MVLGISNDPDEWTCQSLSIRRVQFHSKGNKSGSGSLLQFSITFLQASRIASEGMPRSWVITVCLCPKNGRHVHMSKLKIVSEQVELKNVSAIDTYLRAVYFIHVF